MFLKILLSILRFIDNLVEKFVCKFLVDDDIEEGGNKINYKKSYPQLSSISAEIHQKYEDEKYSDLITNDQTNHMMHEFWRHSNKFCNVRKKLYNDHSRIESFYSNHSSICCVPRRHPYSTKEVTMQWLYNQKSKKYLICVEDERYDDFSPVYFSILNVHDAFDFFIERVKKVHPKYEFFIEKAKKSDVYLGEFDYLYDVGFFDYIGTENEEKNKYLKDFSHNYQYDYDMENLLWKNKYQIPDKKMQELRKEYNNRKYLEMRNKTI